jgi:hypothetical protein
MSLGQHTITVPSLQFTLGLTFKVAQSAGSDECTWHASIITGACCVWVVSLPSKSSVPCLIVVLICISLMTNSIQHQSGGFQTVTWEGLWELLWWERGQAAGNGIQDPTPWSTTITSLLSVGRMWLLKRCFIWAKGPEANKILAVISLFLCCLHLHLAPTLRLLVSQTKGGVSFLWLLVPSVSAVSPCQ